MITGTGSALGIARTRTLVTGALRLCAGQPDVPGHAKRDPARGRAAGYGRRRPGGHLGRLRGKGDGILRLHGGTDDAHPAPGLHTPPAASAAAMGSVAGTVRDVNTGAPVAARSWPSPATTAAWARTCRPTPAPADLPHRRRARAPRVWTSRHRGGGGRLRPREPFRASWSPRRGRHAQRMLRRNWALASGGAPPVLHRTGLQAFGCGPGSVIDGSRRGVWSTHVRARPRRAGAQGA